MQQRMLVLPRDVQPGDVFLSAVDGQPHEVNAVKAGVFKTAHHGEEMIVVLETDGGCRRREIHNLQMPVLIEREVHS